MPYAANYIGYAESAQVLARVAADPDALCIADLNQAVASVRMLGIRLGQGQGISIGSSADIVSGRYPLDRYLYIYVRAPKAGVSERMVCHYLRLLRSDDGQRLLAAAAPDYLPLSQAQREHERQKVKATLCIPSTCGRQQVRFRAVQALGNASQLPRALIVNQDRAAAVAACHHPF